MKLAWKIIYNIFKYSISVIHFIRLTISNILLLTIIGTGIIMYFNLHRMQPISNNTALILDLTGIIVDKPVTHNKFQTISKRLFNINNPGIQENSLFDIINIIRHAKTNPNITGLVLLLKNFSGGSQSSLEYIGKALFEFKNSGKLIYAIADHYNQSQYFLASYANKIYLTPQGSVDLRGFSTNKLYYKSLLEHLKINTHVFRVGSYKSAIEPFTRDNMSHQIRHEESVWIHQLWNQYLKTIASNRNTTIQQIFPGINNVLDNLQKMDGDTAKYALHNKWVDDVLDYSLIENTMQKIFGYNKQGTSFNAISMYDYNIEHTSKNENQIAIICIQGTIIDGVDIANSSGGDSVVHKIRNARFDPKVKSIILRINSPGGSMHASELIRLEIIATKNSGKPVIVSMGSIAASGGYWIATPADYIIASNTTLTGSIGVFGIINTFEKSLNSIGINSDGINTSPIANTSVTTDLPAEFKNMMQLYVNSSYQYFVKTVAQSRFKNINDISHVAQGHIWTGYDAIKHGLIDKIGDFDDAINKASELANLTKYQLNWCDYKTHWMNIILQQTNKIICDAFIKLLYSNIPFTNINESVNIHHNNPSKKIIWNDPKHCYALYYEDILYYN